MKSYRKSIPTPGERRPFPASAKVRLRQEVFPETRRMINFPQFPYDPEDYLPMTDFMYFIISTALQMIQAMYQNFCSLARETSQSFDFIRWNSGERENILEAPNIDDLVQSIQNCAYTTYILPVSLLRENADGHANVLIYDLTRNEYTRFDPHGSYAYDSVFFDEVALDEELRNYMGLVAGKLGRPPPKFITTVGRCYYGPQMIERKFRERGEIAEKELEGYCIAFSLWFVVFKIVNPELSIDDVFRNFNQIRGYIGEGIPLYNEEIFHSVRGLYQKITHYLYDRLFTLYGILLKVRRTEKIQNILYVLDKIFTSDPPNWELFQEIEDLDLFLMLLKQENLYNEKVTAPPLKRYEIGPLIE